MNYNYNLEVITPTHIGDGNSYSNKEYFTSQAKLNKTREVTVINKLNLTEYLKNISSEQQDKFLEKLSHFTIDNKDKREFNFESYIKEQNTIKKYIEYKTIEEIKKEKHPTRIDSTIKNINYKAYIPGSSIKGTIKTAIIYDYLDKENPTTIADYKYICKSPEIEKIMSNISISDSSEYKNNIRTVQIMPFTLIKEGDNKKINDTNKGDMYNAIECIYPYNLNIELKITDEDIITDEYMKKALRLFNYDYIQHEIKFFTKMHENEKDINKKRNILNIIEFYESLKEKNTNDSPLIRLGGSTGLLSTTIGLHMKNNNPNLYHEIYKSNDNKRNQKPGRNTKNNKNEEYPKVRQITPNYNAFGWCKLSSI